jgi:hypothetical protein
VRAIEIIDPVIARYIREPFKWGEHDCALFTARCVDAQLGGATYERLIQEYYHYDNVRKAYRIMIGLGGLERVVSIHLGNAVVWSQLPPGSPLIGRAVDRDVPLLGVVHNNGFVTATHNGLITLPFDFAVKGWDIWHRH